jgi:anti-sigma B factor antagonist
VFCGADKTMPNLLESRVETLDDGVTVVHLSGKIVLGPGAQNLESLVAGLVQNDRTKIVFNLSEVSYIDSTGMGVVVSCLTKAARAGGGLCVACAGERLRQLFKITRLDNVLLFFPTVPAAADTLAGRSAGRDIG